MTWNSQLDAPYVSPPAAMLWQQALCSFSLLFLSASLCFSLLLSLKCGSTGLQDAHLHSLLASDPAYVSLVVSPGEHVVTSDTCRSLSPSNMTAERHGSRLLHEQLSVSPAPLLTHRLLQPGSMSEASFHSIEIKDLLFPSIFHEFSEAPSNAIYILKPLNCAYIY